MIYNALYSVLLWTLTHTHTHACNPATGLWNNCIIAASNQCVVLVVWGPLVYQVQMQFSVCLCGCVRLCFSMFH